jgi:hypothetical protein
MTAEGQQTGLTELCETVKQLLSEELGDDAWYLLTVRLVQPSPRVRLIILPRPQLSAHLPPQTA